MARRVHRSFIDIEEVTTPFFKKQSIPFADQHPDMAEEWCYAKNCGWGPEDFAYASSVKAWWTCPKCHRDYKTTFANRHMSRCACPYCASKITCEETALTTLAPEIASQWHPTKNGKRKPSEFMCYSGKKVWWQCPKATDHVWRSVIAARTMSDSEGAGCPFCHGLKVSDSNSLQLLNAEKAKEWHPTKNGFLTPLQITPSSQIKVWWLCSKGHSYKQSPDQKRGCPFCTGKRVAVSKSLEVVHPKLAKEWHPTKNERLKPKHILPGHNKRAWWQCAKDKNHEWQQSPMARSGRGLGCPFCAGKRVTPENCLATKNPSLAKQWDYTKNEKTPEQIHSSSNKKVWWICPVSTDHNWDQSPNARDRSPGCPFCFNLRASVTNSLATKYPALAEEWHKEKNGPLTPHMVTGGYGKFVWWQCPLDKSHAWQTSPRRRTANKVKCLICFANRAKKKLTRGGK